jgi:para-aminobenzoate synthetase/4-amino-4-deoxychorismate lyase
MLAEAQQRVDRERLWAAGYLSYEAGPAFDPAIVSRTPGAAPLFWLGLYAQPELVRLPGRPAAVPMPTYDWKPSVGRQEYHRSIARIRELISAGDTYQVNYTLRLRASMQEDPWELFLRMVHANDPGYGAFLDCGRFVVCSASPELFLRLEGDHLVSCPMKGTAGRGLWLAQDEVKAQTLHRSAKNRAENVMIVDMVRNDMSRVAAVGSVRVPSLCSLERYPTVWQLTSTVTARTDAAPREILRALFPPASITGAPKARTTQIIAELESSPRGVYTGCIGYIAPGGRAQFNVAIRTAVCDLEQRTIEYGVGGGIVWDSTGESEYEECLLKARIVTDVVPEFSLLETLRWEPGAGYWLLEGHLKRLADSAHYLGVKVDLPTVRERLAELAAHLPPAPHRVRLTVGRAGDISCERSPLAEPAVAEPVRLAVARKPIRSSNPFLYNKTTYRRMYDEAIAGQSGCDDVVLWNERGEVTETTICNIVMAKNGQLVTPAVSCGLLPGVFRGSLLARGKIREATLTLEELRRAQRLFVVNSVRGCRPAVLKEEE